MRNGTLLYAQSGGVTAVINATARAVIQAARARKVKVLAARNGILGALREELIDTSQGAPASDPGAGAYARRRLRLLPLQAQVAGSRPRQVRAPARRVQGPRRALVPLQRRQRFGRHRAQGLAAGGRVSATR